MPQAFSLPGFVTAHSCENTVVSVFKGACIHGMGGAPPKKPAARLHASSIDPNGRPTLRGRRGNTGKSFGTGRRVERETQRARMALQGGPRGIGYSSPPLQGSYHAGLRTKKKCIQLIQERCSPNAKASKIGSLDTNSMRQDSMRSKCKFEETQHVERTLVMHSNDRQLTRCSGGPYSFFPPTIPQLKTKFNAHKRTPMHEPDEPHSATTEGREQGKKEGDTDHVLI